MPINLTDYNKMVVGNTVVHQGTPPEPGLVKLRKKLAEEQKQIVQAQQTSVSTSLKTSAYQQDMLTNK